MIRPTIEEARALCEHNTIIPISIELFSDMKTPIEVLKCLKEKSDKCYLLESVEGGEKWGRYSFLGYNPKLALKCTNGKVEILNGVLKTYYTNPKELLRRILSEYKSPKIDFLPPFTGGFVGYISYEFIKYSEKSIKLENIDSDDFDDLNLMLFDKIIAFDYLRQKIIIIVNIQTDDFESNYINAVVTLKEIENMIESEKTVAKYNSNLLSEFTPLFSKDEYCHMVEKVKHHIFEGNIFQAVISNRMEAQFEGDLLSTYRALRTINPSPYMFYMSLGDTQIAGASPETLLSLKNNKLSTFPIAGTCPRGKSEEEDENLMSELLKNEKELSEHNMLVDLGRNDLGKISEFGSVKVEDYQKILKFSHVSHIASTVTGTIKQGLDQIDAISAVLPAGTLSGAPKIRACEIINELEGHKRGIYGGAIGYIDFAGNMDMCIAIRMAVSKNKKIYVQAGAGIVADSIPENEYNECINKAEAMIKAIKFSREVE
ncbi:MAG: anthranilate synthase component I [Clostridiales bacterium GWF2_38_85]|nr:MAG: anthranilate synthase component I [Clostridiales bacterium GWF2_38_85]HBL84983.1 anthranilate synthase component I [Clostridiales bacterium]